MSKPILEEKDILNPNEAIELFVLSRRKFYKLLKENRNLGFLAMYGSRKLIIRSEFQKYLDKHPELKRRGSCWQAGDVTPSTGSSGGENPFGPIGNTSLSTM